MLEGVKHDDAVYFVHSFRAALTSALEPWALTTTDYGEKYVSSVQRGRVVAFQQCISTGDDSRAWHNTREVPRSCARLANGCSW